MKKVLKLLCLALCISMLLTSFLTGCTKDSGDDPEPGKTSDPAKTSDGVVDTKPELEPYEVKWFFGGSGGEPDEKMVEDEIGKYLKDKINTTVDIVQIPLGEYNQRLMPILQSGEKADLIFSCSWTQTVYFDQARTGLLTEITDEMLDKYAPNIKKVLGATPFLEGAKVDGKLYNIACNKEVGRQGGVLLNKALVDKYKFDLSTLKKYADLEPMLQKIKDNEPDVYPLGTCGNDTVEYLTACYGDWSSSILIRFPMNGTKWVPVTDIPEIVDIWRTMKRYGDLGFTREDAISYPDVMPDLKAGKVFATHMQLKPGKDKEFSPNTPGIEWVQVGLTDYVVPTGDTTGSMMAIPATCEKPDRVLMFYDFFYHDKEMLTMVNFGIKDKHYVKIDENTIDYAPKTEGGKKSGWVHDTGWVIGNQFINYIKKGEDPNKYENLKNFNAQCKPFGESTGFIFDSSKCSDLVAKFNASGSDYYNLLNLGLAKDVDKAIEDQLKVWNEAGLQELLAEYEKQFAKFKASK
ncbi:MAG: ABC transporter substrate-binding protein [Clostridiaceae bacterium]